MNILLINHYAGAPELGMEFRPYYLAREWQKMGHQVLIVGATFSHLRKKQPSKGYQTIDGVNYLWLSTNKYSGNDIGRFVSMLCFVFQLFVHFSTLKKFNSDVVIASSTYLLDNYPARRIAKASHAEYVYEIHDLWPLSPIELGGMSPHHPFIRIMQRAENFAYKNCDKCVSILPKANAHAVKHGLAPQKFFCVPNGIVESDWKNPMELVGEHADLLKQLHAEHKIIVGFTGAHGVANSLQPLIGAVGMLAEKNIALVLVGTGQEKARLIRYAADQGWTNVYFLPSVGKQMIPSLLKNMDILYVGLRKRALFQFGISPNKIFDYMMASKPILQAIEAGNDLAKDADCGITVEPDNVAKIADAITTLANMAEKDRDRLGQNGHDYVLKYHTYDVLAKQFIDILAKQL